MPSTPQTQLCRALKAEVRRRSAAAVPCHQGEGEERRAPNTNEGGGGALPLIVVTPCCATKERGRSAVRLKRTFETEDC